MEEDQEFKHVCKFCSKSFPCGRSLGGHMRSHMVNEISAQSDGTKLTKKKLPPLTTVNGSTLINNNNNNKRISTETTGYGLRENPKKTWRLKDHPSEDNFHRFCKGCGKFFQSWKSHFDHMKCHSVEKERLLNVGILEEDQDSWTGCDNQKLVMDDTQSINETPAPNRRKRSKRRIRYMGTANSSSSSVSFPSNVSCSSEIDQEQEEVAMCLMMLSRDVGKWGGLNFLAESSDNNSLFLETNLVSSKTEGKNSDSEGFDTDKWKKVGENKSKIGKLELQDFRVEDGKTDFSASGISGKVVQVFKNDRIKKYELDNHCGIRNSEETGLNQVEMVSNISISIKRKFRGAPFHDPELTSKPIKKLRTNALDSEKNSKFECESCNKVFSSYQALGGHRASHKKIRSCLSSRIDNNGNTIDTGISLETPPHGDLIIKPTTNELPNHQFGTGNYDPEAETSHGPKRSKKHECPICLKVFPSGQALGGHKRSHLVSGIEAKIEPSIRIQEDSVPEIRGFLDLNLPAPVEEEAKGFDHPWWTGTSHKHETLIGLIT